VYDPATRTPVMLDDPLSEWANGTAVTLDDGRGLLPVRDGPLSAFDPAILSISPLIDRPEGFEIPVTATLLEDGRVLQIGHGPDCHENTTVLDTAALPRPAQARAS
jgi:hypothetical protein